MKWNTSKGEDRYRRSLYTFTKRTAPFVASAVFDGPSGENCLSRRNRSNTPLQALTLLNDEMFMEMARAAAKDLSKGEDGIRELFRRFLTRQPTDDEVAALKEFYDTQSERELDGVDAMTLVARAIMNLDEVITRN